MSGDIVELKEAWQIRFGPIVHERPDKGYERECYARLVMIYPTANSLRKGVPEISYRLVSPMRELLELQGGNSQSAALWDEEMSDDE